MVKIKFSNKKKSTFRSRMEFDLRVNARNFFPFVSREEDKLNFSNLSNYIRFVETRLTRSIEEVERLERQTQRIQESIEKAMVPSDDEWDEEVDCVPVPPATSDDWDNWEETKSKEPEVNKDTVLESGTQTEPNKDDVPESPESPSR